eukprot:1415014-Prymnesium_polylepis.2
MCVLPPLPSFPSRGAEGKLRPHWHGQSCRAAAAGCGSVATMIKCMGAFLGAAGGVAMCFCSNERRRARIPHRRFESRWHARPFKRRGVFRRSFRSFGFGPSFISLFGVTGWRSLRHAV